ncbi:hypothetical protein EJ08DRAFT_276627 [Tothia fuscella]|uniref:Putative phospholipase n=1 Tax=Tothia fuscella TaxID=1048955 RepID=A0A9P4NQ06_9PEZI|nr:hypothetical protein EJ08DRAFT_276627 [Tothia fuscella]
MWPFVPGFPKYTGPYSVGSVDVELPVDKLDSPSPAPVDADIGTVAFRIFYPSDGNGSSRPVRWVPGPQRAHLSAYGRFLGANSIFSEAFSFLSQNLYYTSIPAIRNAALLASPTSSKRWPVMIFSHGLGGSRNAYSQVLGSIASHGVIVIASDHRDGSAPLSYVRATATSPAKLVDYEKYSHSPTPEVYAGRDRQLKTRLWELGLIHDGLLKIDEGHYPENLDPNSTSTWKKDFNDVLKMFVGQLDVHRPGSITWAGHSFGATSTVQLLKSTYWQTTEPNTISTSPIFNPSPSSRLAAQITPSSPAILLDMWCLPFRSPDTRLLWEKPMPCYASSGPGGIGLLSILSEAFFKWSGNSKDVIRIISPPTGSSKAGPHCFYPRAAAHLSQSDFGVLFPWPTKKVFKTEDPKRYITLNVRAVLEMLRINGFEVAPTSKVDMELTADEQVKVDDSGHDWKILDKNGAIDGWVNVKVPKEVRSNENTENDKRRNEGPVETEVLGEVKI